MVQKDTAHNKKIYPENPEESIANTRKFCPEWARMVDTLGIPTNVFYDGVYVEDITKKDENQLFQKILKKSKSVILLSSVLNNRFFGKDSNVLSLFKEKLSEPTFYVETYQGGPIMGEEHPATHELYNGFLNLLNEFPNQVSFFHRENRFELTGLINDKTMMFERPHREYESLRVHHIWNNKDLLSKMFNNINNYYKDFYQVSSKNIHSLDEKIKPQRFFQQDAFEKKLGF